MSDVLRFDIEDKVSTHFSVKRLNDVPGVITKLNTFYGNYTKFTIFPIEVIGKKNQNYHFSI